MKKFLWSIPKLIIFVFIIYYTSQQVFLKIAIPHILEGDKKLLESGITVLESALKTQSKTIELFTRDWGYWDDSYEFVQKYDQTIVDSNFNDETLFSAGINMVVFYNLKGDVIFKKAIPLYEGQLSEIPSEAFKTATDKAIYNDITTTIATKRPIVKHIHTQQGLLTYSIAPVLRSNGGGEVRGVLLLGRYFNKQDEEFIKKATKLDFDTFNYLNAEEKIQNKLSTTGGEFDEFRRESMSRYKIIYDSFNKPALYIKFNYPRVVNLTYEKVIPLYALFTAVFGGLSLVLYERIVDILKHIAKNSHFS